MTALRSLASDARTRTRVILTLRADFLDRPLAVQSFGDLLRPGVVMLTAPSAEGLAAAITLPAQRVGVDLEPGLESEIMRDVIDQPGGLPLLEYSLTRLFERRQDGLLTAAAFYESGGVLGAVGQRAESLYSQLEPNDQRVVRQVFLRLVEVSRVGDDTRRRVPLPELAGLAVDSAVLEHVLDSYAANRLLTFDRDAQTRTPTVEVAHEALLHSWDRLRNWIDDRREDLLVRSRLNGAAHEWDGSGRASEYLVSNGRLAQFESWAATTDLSPTDEEQALLEASRRHADEVDAGRRRRRQGIMAGFAAAAVVAAGLATAAYLGQRSAQEEAQVNRARELTAASLDEVDEDGQLALLLAIEAAEVSRSATGDVLPGTTDALRRAVLVSRLVQAIPLDELPIGRSVGLDVNGQGLVAVSSTGDTIELRQDDALDTLVATLGTALDVEVGVEARPGFDPTGERVAVVGSDGAVHVWDVESRQKVWSQERHIPEPGAAVFSPDGALLVTTGTSLAVMWDATTGSELWSVPIESPGLPAFSVDGSRLVIGAWISEGLEILDVESGEVLERVPLGDSVGSVAWSPEGDRIFAGLERGDIVVVDAATLENIGVWYGHSATPLVLVIDAPGGRLASGSDDGTVRVWDVDSGRGLMVLSGQAGSVLCVGFLPGGTHLVSTGSDRVLRHFTESECAAYRIDPCPTPEE